MSIYFSGFTYGDALDDALFVIKKHVSGMGAGDFEVENDDMISIMRRVYPNLPTSMLNNFPSNSYPPLPDLSALLRNEDIGDLGDVQNIPRNHRGME